MAMSSHKQPEPELAAPESPVEEKQDATKQSRRTLIKGGVAAVPVIVTLRSRSALAQASATQSGFQTGVVGPPTEGGNKKKKK